MTLERESVTERHNAHIITKVNEMEALPTQTTPSWISGRQSKKMRYKLRPIRDPLLNSIAKALPMGLLLIIKALATRPQHIYALRLRSARKSE